MREPPSLLKHVRFVWALLIVSPRCCFLALVLRSIHPLLSNCHISLGKSWRDRGFSFAPFPYSLCSLAGNVGFQFAPVFIVNERGDWSRPFVVLTDVFFTITKDGELSFPPVTYITPLLSNPFILVPPFSPPQRSPPLSPAVLPSSKMYGSFRVLMRHAAQPRSQSMPLRSIFLCVSQDNTGFSVNSMPTPAMLDVLFVLLFLIFADYHL